MCPSDDPQPEAQDRTAVLSAVWLPAGLVALGMIYHGFAGAGGAWLRAGFVALPVGCALHVNVSAPFEATFTAKEAALSFVLYAAAGLALVLAVLLQFGVAETFFLPVAAGIAEAAAAVVFCPVTPFWPPILYSPPICRRRVACIWASRHGWGAIWLLARSGSWPAWAVLRC